MAYISNKLTHWVGSKEREKEQYGILTINILKEKQLLFGSPPWSLSSEYPLFNTSSFNMISFTDIPLSESEYHCSKYSKFGISFNKRYLAQIGATPVAYIQNSGIQGNMTFILKALKDLEPILNRNNILEWDLKNFTPYKKASLNSILNLLLYNAAFTEKYFKDQMQENEQKFNDSDVLYFEREWRIIYGTLIQNKDYIVKIRDKVYFKFDERFIECIIIPKRYMSQFEKEKEAIFLDYNPKHIPRIMVYENLRKDIDLQK